jgi:hypothetical protein
VESTQPVPERKSLKCNLPTEVYSRVVGYFRPVTQWNLGKQAEFKERVTFNGGSVIKFSEKGRFHGASKVGDAAAQVSAGASKVSSSPSKGDAEK